MSKENAIVLRKMARYIRRHGFSPGIGEENCPRCFIGARSSVGDLETNVLTSTAALCGVLGVPLDSGRLRDHGWTTQDAAAACDIAADLES